LKDPEEFAKPLIESVSGVLRKALLLEAVQLSTSNSRKRLTGGTADHNVTLPNFIQKSTGIELINIPFVRTSVDSAFLALEVRDVSLESERGVSISLNTCGDFKACRDEAKCEPTGPTKEIENPRTFLALGLAIKGHFKRVKITHA
jgi:hypothetical protein